MDMERVEANIDAGRLLVRDRSHSAAAEIPETRLLDDIGAVAPLSWGDSARAHASAATWLNWPLDAGMRMRLALVTLRAWPDAEPEEIRDVALAMGRLSQEFSRVSAWLARSAQSGWEGTSLERPPRGRHSVLGEPHRIIVQDWFFSDSSYLIGWLLQRVVRQLQVPPLSSVPVAAPLQPAIAMLERACILESECVRFFHEFQARWQVLRDQVDSALSQCHDHDPAHDPSGRSAAP